jgi:hypothetical protein
MRWAPRTQSAALPPAAAPHAGAVARLIIVFVMMPNESSAKPCGDPKKRSCLKLLFKPLPKKPQYWEVRASHGTASWMNLVLLSKKSNLSTRHFGFRTLDGIFCEPPVPSPDDLIGPSVDFTIFRHDFKKRLCLYISVRRHESRCRARLRCVRLLCTHAQALIQLRLLSRKNTIPRTDQLACRRRFRYLNSGLAMSIDSCYGLEATLLNSRPKSLAPQCIGWGCYEAL